MVESRLVLTSFSWIVRSLLRVTRNAARAATRKPPKSASSRGADHVLQQDEPALAVARRRAAGPAG